MIAPKNFRVTRLFWWYTETVPVGISRQGRYMGSRGRGGETKGRPSGSVIVMGPS